MELETLIAGKDLRRMLGNVSPTTLFNWRRDRGFPEPVRLSCRKIAWRSRDVQAWIKRADAQTRANHSITKEIENV